MLDLGGLANRMQLWPRIELVDSTDAGPVALCLPDTVDSGVAVVPKVLVRNYGLASFNVPARLRIGSDYDTTASRTIGPNRQDTVSFASWTPLTLGWHTARCSTVLAGDENPGNDALVDSVFVRRHQVGMTAPLAIEPKPATFKVWPNPASGVVSLSWREPLALYNSAGRKAAELGPGLNDIHVLARGVYFLPEPEKHKRLKLVLR